VGAHVGPRAAMSRRTATSATAPTPSPAWRNRITGIGEEAPDQLLANPGNWRVHPKAQQDALAGALDAVGWVEQRPNPCTRRYSLGVLARLRAQASAPLRRRSNARRRRLLGRPSPRTSIIAGPASGTTGELWST
jgi:hypothetical protein